MAICFGNRVAACQALNQVNGAVADYNLAIALDKSCEGSSKRASLPEIVF